MSTREKLIQKILADSKNITFDETRSLLIWLGFEERVRGSHHGFQKDSMGLNITLKKRPQLLAYQVQEVREVLKKHGYKEKTGA